MGLKYWQDFLWNPNISWVLIRLLLMIYLLTVNRTVWLSSCLHFLFLNSLHFWHLSTAGALLFFALLGLSGCFITCYDRRVRNDLAQPCRELCLCCCQPGYSSAVLIYVWVISLYIIKLLIFHLVQFSLEFFLKASLTSCPLDAHFSSVLTIFFL